MPHCGIQHDLVRDKWITIAVTSDPAADAQKWRNAQALAETRFYLLFQAGINIGNFTEKSIAIIG